MRLKVELQTRIPFSAMRRLLLALLLLLAACSDAPPSNATGQEIYTQVCATCHGADLSGGIGLPLGPGSNAANQPDEYLRVTITNGRGRMPSFANTLSESQIDAVIGYIREVQSD